MKYHARTVHFFGAALSLAIALSGCSTSNVAHRQMNRDESRPSRPVRQPGTRYKTKTDRSRDMSPTAGPAKKSEAAKSIRAQNGGDVSKKDPAQTQRLVVYSANLHMEVPELEQTLDKIRDTASGAGGFLQSLDGNVISIKVPSSSFQQVVKAIANLGAVQSKQINGQDVTEEVHDLKTRLKNAENMRDRMAKLLERSQNIEEALRIEKELARIAETIEVMKGKVEYLEHNAAFSRITVTLTQPRVSRVATGPRPLQQVPFLWVRSLGSEITRGSPEQVNPNNRRFFKIRFDLPENYIKYDEKSDYTRGMSGSAVLIKVARHENLEGGTLAFWQDIIERSLQEQRVVNISKTEELKTSSGGKLVLVKGTKKLGSLEFAYRIAIGRTNKRVYVYEAWGPAKELAKDEDKLIDSMKTMRL